MICWRARSIFFAALLLVISTVFGGAAAQDISTKKYPPYPDVWGRELPFPEKLSVMIQVIDPFLDAKGRILIPYAYLLAPDFRRSRYLLYNFLTGKLVGDWEDGKGGNPPGYKGVYDYLGKNGFRRLKQIVPTLKKSEPLPDGGRLERTSALWFDYLTYGLRKTDAAGREVFNWMIVHVADTPRYIQGSPQNEFFSDDADDYVRTTAPFADVYLLADGTFLLTGMSQALVLRYRGNLESPYIQRSGKVLLMDPKRAIQMHERAMKQTERRLIKIRKRHPDMPWLMPEFTDMVFTGKIKLLIHQKRKEK